MNQVKIWNVIYCILHSSTFLAEKWSIATSIKLWIVFISSLWIDKTDKAFSLSGPIRFRENVLICFKVLKHFSEYAADIGVGKIMLQNGDTAGNVWSLKLNSQNEPVASYDLLDSSDWHYREIFGRIWKRFKAVPAEENFGFDYMHRSSISSCFFGNIGKNQMQRPANL